MIHPSNPLGSLEASGFDGQSNECGPLIPKPLNQCKQNKRVVQKCENEWLAEKNETGLFRVRSISLGERMACGSSEWLGLGWLRGLKRRQWPARTGN